MKGVKSIYCIKECGGPQKSGEGCLEIENQRVRVGKKSRLAVVEDADDLYTVSRSLASRPPLPRALRHNIRSIPRLGQSSL
jgi:hypothetical protein